MPAVKFLASPAAILAVSLAATTIGHAGDWLGGQYWGQIAGCAHCGGSMYGGGLPPGAIWVGEIGCGGGPGCGCATGKGDVGPIMIGDELPDPTPVTPSVIPSDEIVPDPPSAASADAMRAESFSRRVSYIEAAGSDDRQFRPRSEQVRIVTHASQPERLRREPIRIVSPDGSAGRMYR